jgi:PAS domain S-box-containing protein
MFGCPRQIVKCFWWIPALAVLFLLFFARHGSCRTFDPLTPEERSWLAEHPVIRVAPDPEYQPLEYFTENGVYQGITADYLSLIEKRLGIRFQVVRLRNREEIFHKLRNRQIDVIGAATKTPQRTSYLLFTRPYLEIPLVIITRKKPDRALAPDQLPGKRVSVVTEHVSGEFISLAFPMIVPDMVPDVRTGLRKVSFGSSDVLLENLLIATFLMEKEGITNLRVAGELGYSYRPAIASRSDWPELNRILEKGLAGISANEKEVIYKKWVPFESQVMLVSKRSRRALFAGFGLAILIILGIFGWNRSLTRLVNRKTAELNKELVERKRVEKELLHARDDLEQKVAERTSELAETLYSLRKSEEKYRCLIDTANEGICVLDQDFRFSFVNGSMADMLGYGAEELMGKSYATFLLAEELPEHEKEMEARRRGEPSRYERRFRSNNGGTVWGLISVTPLLDSECQFLGCFAMCVDITDRKQAEAALQAAHAELESRVRERTLQLTELTEELSRAEERERRRIATELHDQVGQMLALSKINLNSLSPSLPADRFTEMLGEVREHINQSIHEIRSLTFQLSPPLLYEVGLGAALEALCDEFDDKYPIHVYFRDDGKPESLSVETRVALYQMVRELMVNVVKHARAGKLLIEMSAVTGSLEISVEDDGVGFDSSQEMWYTHVKRSFGLFSIQHRINHLGGKFVIQSEIGRGSRAALMIPVPENANFDCRRIT